MLEQGYDFSEVVLEDDAVLTTKCTVVGARIGRRSYVGAGAVVVDDIPAYSVAVGVPARVVDSFGPEGDREAAVAAASAQPASRSASSGPAGGGPASA